MLAERADLAGSVLADRGGACCLGFVWAFGRPKQSRRVEPATHETQAGVTIIDFGRLGLFGRLFGLLPPLFHYVSGCFTEKGRSRGRNEKPRFYWAFPTKTGLKSGGR